MCVHAKSLQSCTTLCGPMDCSPTRLLCAWDSPARVLESVAMLSSRGSSQPRDQPVSPVAPALQEGSLWLSHQGSPVKFLGAL